MNKTDTLILEFLNSLNKDRVSVFYLTEKLRVTQTTIRSSIERLLNLKLIKAELKKNTFKLTKLYLYTD